MAPASPSSETESKSPLLYDLIAGCDPERKHFVLDLGPACGANVASLSHLHCRLTIGDCLEELADVAPPEEDDEGDALHAALEQVLPCRPPGELDLVLCWDVLNYLSRPVLATFADQLSRCLKPGAQLHAIISPLESIPAGPGHYEMMGEGRLRIRHEATGTRPSPRYHQPDLERLMPWFVVVRSVLLSSGVQEYLFRYEPSQR